MYSTSQPEEAEPQLRTVGVQSEGALEGHSHGLHIALLHVVLALQQPQVDCVGEEEVHAGEDAREETVGGGGSKEVDVLQP